MSTNTENLNIKITASTEKANKSLREMRKELLALDEQMKQAPNEEVFKKLEQEYADLRKEIADTRESYAALDTGDLLKNWTTLFNTGIQGFGAITGALSLFGVENEKLQRIEQKSTEIIKVMIAAENLRQITLDDGYKKWLQNLVKTTAGLFTQKAATDAQTTSTVAATTATTALGTAMNALPFVAIVSILGTLVGAFINYSRRVKDAAKDNKSFADSLDRIRAAGEGIDYRLIDINNNFKELTEILSDNTRSTYEHNAALKELSDLTGIEVDDREKAIELMKVYNDKTKENRDALSATTSQTARYREELKSLAIGSDEYNKKLAAIEANLRLEERLRVKIKAVMEELTATYGKAGAAMTDINISTAAKEEIKVFDELHDYLTSLSMPLDIFDKASQTITSFIADINTELKSLGKKPLKNVVDIFKLFGADLKGTPLAGNYKILSQIVEKFNDLGLTVDDSLFKILELNANAFTIPRAKEYWDNVKKFAESEGLMIEENGRKRYEGLAFYLYNLEVAYNEDIKKEGLTEEEKTKLFEKRTIQRMQIINKYYTDKAKREQKARKDEEAAENERIEAEKAAEAERQRIIEEGLLKTLENYVAANEAIDDALKSDYEKRLAENNIYFDSLELATKQAYDQELITKEEFEDDMLKITKARTKKEAELNREVAQSIAQSIGESVGQVSGMINSLMQYEQDHIDATVKDTELAEKKKKEVRKKYAVAEALMSISDIGVSTATGIMNIWEKWGENPVVAGIFTGILSATAAVQTALAIKNANDIKKYGRGGIIYGPSHSQGGTLIEAEGGEAIMNRKAVQQYGSILSSINTATGGVPIPIFAGGSAAAANTILPADTVRCIVRETIAGMSSIPVIVTSRQIDVADRKYSARRNISVF